MKKLFVLFLSCLMVLSLVGCAQKNPEPSQTDPEPVQNDEDKISVEFDLQLEDESWKNYQVKVSKGATVREALYEAGLIEEEEMYSFMVQNIDGNEAKMEDGVLWYLYNDDGTPMEASFDEVTVNDGQKILIIYTVAPNFDD